ncbi:hypothetical protein MA16_Dca005713 [Dendrobium catenatum]|uniref:Uncharacterized protein n=1 Tax=Dendrobium catenatum TaxID=906689 RepID=A0A2I0WQG1_9ASPA|nr:hypothetical protein MA16_Dca005713 [Dendrobium catenatum]
MGRMGVSYFRPGQGRSSSNQKVEGVIYRYVNGSVVEADERQVLVVGRRRLVLAWKSSTKWSYDYRSFGPETR